VKRRYSPRITALLLVAAPARLLGQAVSPEYDRLSEADRLHLTAGYVELARDLRSPEPCNKISSTESWSAPWSAKGFQTGYQKSLCFDALAAAPEMRKFGEGAMVGLWMTAYGEMVKNAQLSGHLGDLPDFSGATIRHHIADPAWCAHAAAGPRS